MEQIRVRVQPHQTDLFGVLLRHLMRPKEIIVKQVHSSLTLRIFFDVAHVRLFRSTESTWRSACCLAACVREYLVLSTAPCPLFALLSPPASPLPLPISSSSPLPLFLNLFWHQGRPSVGIQVSLQSLFLAFSIRLQLRTATMKGHDLTVGGAVKEKLD
eukprot:767137-Hanusia_phi.AAC.26